MTDWADLPLVLEVKHLAKPDGVLPYAKGTIYAKLQRRKMDPPPISYGPGKKLWGREAVRNWVERHIHTAPQSKRKPLLTVPPAVRVAPAQDVRAVAQALLKGA